MMRQMWRVNLVKQSSLMVGLNILVILLRRLLLVETLLALINGDLTR